MTVKTTSYKIKEFREEKGWSQEELANKSNVSRSIISELETGKRIATGTVTLMKIAKALEVPMREIFLN
ncbi:transcriptional regulator [Aerococcus viridans]|uniref:Transcriptional regulator n=1 Tax=Aerococcus viridans TaxID=1377 RepID=A0A2N6UFY7_9LACT|nr:helix-turn-helix transcriptional regulator [Aerococcus viridans]PMC80480.1 transcriptional regulator [Aerococcus viridans]